MADLNLPPIGTTSTPAPRPARPLRLPGSGTSDGFHQQAGPDVRVNGSGGPVAMFAVFTVNPETDEVQVAVFDDRGLVRLIPPESVFQMVTMMRSYKP